MLKKIEIKGFKSFADRTVIDFDSGVCCIVGPNGSGKSNITDAFRWVLGEQSYKSLRGKQMSDVIFNGTVSRLPLGYAEVNVVIDNKNGLLDLPYTEISVLRRLYRSGESVYSINGNTCRLKDIKELFLDTGIGVEGYSIIGQGRIDQLLSSGKEDRRAIFEEASGIVKYKGRKEEAKRKLDRTRLHLERIDDIYLELEQRVGPLKEQSEKAKRYIDIKNELKSIELSLYLQEIDKIKFEYDDYNKALEQFESESEVLAKELFKSKEKNGELSIKINEIQLKRQSLLDERYSTEKKGIEGQGHLKLLDERIEIGEEKINEFSQSIDNLTISIEKIEKELEVKLSNLEKSKDIYLKRKENTDKIKAEFDLKNIELEKAESDFALLKYEKRDYFENLNKLERENLQFGLHLEEAEKRLNQIEIELSANDEAKTLGFEHLNQIKHNINLLDEELKSFLSQKLSIETKIGDGRIDIEAIENEIYKFQSKNNELESKIAITRNRIENFENLSEPTREVLKKAENDMGIYGTVASLIDIDKKYEKALEQILGRRGEYIVSDSFDTAKDYIEFLKENRLGRLSFLPLSDLRANDIIDIDYSNGILGHAMDFISCDDELEPAIRYLLYNVAFSEDLESAKYASKRAPNGYKIVSLDGDVVNVGGSVSGGYKKSTKPGLFKDKNDLEALEISKTDVELKLKELKSDRENKVNLLQIESTELASIQSTIEEFRTKLLNEKALLDAANSRLLGGIESEKNKLSEKSELLDKTHEIKKSIDLNTQEREKLNLEHEKIESGNEERKAFIENQRLECKNLSDLINSEILELNKDEFEYKSKNSEYNNLKEKCEENKLALDKIYVEQKFAKEILFKQIEEKKEYEIKLKQNSDKQINIISEINNLETELDVIKKKNSAEYTHYKSLETKLSELKDSMYAIRINTGKLEAKLESQEQGLWEDYEMTYAGASEHKIEISYNKAKTSIREFKKELEEIGDVNLLAIEEYKEVSERYEFLSTQKNDLNESIDKLGSIIDEMDEKMRETFTASLIDINEKFKATFTGLFKGGMATIEMAEGEDVLDAEIIINAQPPGKRLQTIELLSGGEKALTAIAILFAILKTKPAPFCILDEIEAALDDRNIALFSEFLDDYKVNSQFIIISHRKGTIQIADSLYGVTMKEKGISSVLSLKLSQGEDNLMLCES